MRRFFLRTGLLAGLLFILSHQAQGAELADLVKGLSDASPDARAKAAMQIGSLGKDALPAVDDLAKSITDPDPRVRRAAIGALREIKPGREVSIKLLGSVLSDSDPKVAIVAVQSLADWGKEAVPLMTEALKDEKAGYWATLVLTDIGPDAAPAVPTLLEILANAKPESQREIVMCLASIGPGSKEATPTLIKLLSDKDHTLDHAAVYALGSIGPDASSATEDLRKTMVSTDPFLQTISAWALAKVNPDDKEIQKEVTPFLVDMLLSKVRGVRLVAARSLVDLKPDHAIFLPELEIAMQKATPEMISDALSAFAAVGPKAVPGMIRMLKYDFIRPGIAQILGQIGPEAKDAAPALVAALKESDPTAKREILMALGHIGDTSEAVIGAAQGELGSDEPEVRYAAIFTLGNLGPAAKDSKAELVKNLDGDDEWAALTSAWALAQIDAADVDVAAKIAPILVTGLASDRDFVRIEAAEALGKLGAHAAAAKKALAKSAAEDPSEEVKKAASEALEAINK